MSRHEPDEDGRCRATDLLVTDCSGCRGSDESFVDALLASEPEPEADYGVPDDQEPDYDAELRARALRPVSFRDPATLNTGPADPKRLARMSRPFPAHYTGGKCPACPRGIFERQMIVKTNLGYAHASCLEEQ